MKFGKQFIKEIDAILPQTHCRQCGFSGCKPYATAIVEGQADINQCPPGDTDVIQKIAKLLGIAPKPLNTSHGQTKPRAVAVIDENHCIGCTFCIRSCPVDAIVGAAKQMHTVINDECTGCELCIAPCPMDCIRMVPVPKREAYTDFTVAGTKRRADRARMRYLFRLQRLEQNKSKSKGKVIPERPSTSDNQIMPNQQRKQAIVQAALKRAAAMRVQADNK
ncbi:MAG: electron transport complex subunit RsxB [Burkholderiales bacterium]|nr:electron transport complex subunit RsxB [Nitrosomonas sp.]MCP5275621.1 electron transport complex subunit RsxB [Burkholderiales bacterium]